MQWPSTTVPQGGVFQPARVNYSNDTKNFLKTLIDEAKMTTMQRNKINYSLRSGEPLPPISSYQSSGKQEKYQVLIRPGSSKRRTYDSIKNSGAYDRDKFKPVHPRVDREAIKQEFADKMAFGKEIKPKPPKSKSELVKKEKEKEAITRYDELKMEIQERQDWLEKMEILGEADKHRLVINQQIQQKLREIEGLKIRDN